MSGVEWVTAHFEQEFCAECGGDACHHTPVEFHGNWFARCDFQSVDLDADTVGEPEDHWHPVIAAYRSEVAS